MESFSVKYEDVLSCISEAALRQPMDFANWESYYLDRKNKQLTKRAKSNSKRISKRRKGSCGFRKEYKEGILELNL